eukprot:TRINITY_DN6648_c0_g1_i1.p1 TRINITY_DN6648_c0_g1~~TRINITY_DN6648_c0_g1_i1.p1  ORF type:complete len:270 (-),score=78.71 TRINITY_DN6648_c0_g1_i1:40-849(-)
MEEYEEAASRVLASLFDAFDESLYGAGASAQDAEWDHWRALYPQLRIVGTRVELDKPGVVFYPCKRKRLSQQQRHSRTPSPPAQDEPAPRSPRAAAIATKHAPLQASPSASSRARLTPPPPSPPRIPPLQSLAVVGVAAPVAACGDEVLAADGNYVPPPADPVPQFTANDPSVTESLAAETEQILFDLLFGDIVELAHSFVAVTQAPCSKPCSPVPRREFRAHSSDLPHSGSCTVTHLPSIQRVASATSGGTPPGKHSTSSGNTKRVFL